MKEVWRAIIRLTSVTLNLASGGDFELLCARVGRNVFHRQKPRIIWQTSAAILDGLFRHDPHHCKQCFIRGMKPRQGKYEWIWQA